MRKTTIRKMAMRITTMGRTVKRTTNEENKIILTTMRRTTTMRKKTIDP